MGQEKKIVILGLLALMIVVILLINSGMGSEGMMNYNRSDPSESNLSSITSVMAGLEGFGIGLLDAPIGTAEHGMRKAQFLKPGENLSGYISVINHYHEANDYLIFCLLDYRQVPFTFDNESGQILHKIHLESYEAGFYPFELAEIEDGGHDFEIVVMFRPYENNTRFNEKFRVDVWTGRLGSMRLNLFVGNYSDLPALNYTNMSAISCCSCAPEYFHAEAILIAKEPCSKHVWRTEDVEPGGLLNYTINAGTYDNPVTLAMMVLLDYEPIPINVNGTELVIFGKFEPGEYVAIPASLIVPEEKGVHELLVLWFPVPYKKLEILPGVKARFEQWPWTKNERVGLNVTGG
jgi:hypothetical protein